MKTFALLASVAVLALSAPASAAVITSLPGGVSQFMPITNSFTAGPVTFGDITYSSTTSNSVIGYNNGYGFASNGGWSGGLGMAGLNTDRGTMTFTFAAPVGGVMADINWAPCCSSGLPVTLAIYDSANTLLESFQLADGSSNSVAPGYWGFQRGQGDIAYMTMSNGYVGARDFSTLVGGAVPEPATWALMISGFGMVGATLRRRKTVAVTA